MWSHIITVVPERSNYVKNSTSVMALVCRHRATHIFPDLVVKLVKDDLIIRDAVVQENTLGFCTRRVHRKPKGAGKWRKERENRVKGDCLMRRDTITVVELQWKPAPVPAQARCSHRVCIQWMSCPSHVLRWQPDL